MSCYACNRKYGMFCKESGCGNCGFSFCLKCLKKEIEVPRHKDEIQKVCLRCYEKLFAAASAAKESSTAEMGSTNKNKIPLEPNEIFQITDPSNSLDPVLQPISLSSASSPLQENVNSEEITGNLDSEILKRLHGLRQDQPQLSDDELRLRLSNLQGFQPKEYSKKDILLSMDQRTEQEKISDLLKQFVEEADIDTNAGGCDNDPISEIERRLAALRDTDPTESTKKQTADPNTPSDNEEDEETLLKNIIQRYVDESQLPASSADVGSLSKEFVASIPKNEATEELPWCTVCNEDAVIRCQTCDGDLFCKACFKECHQDDEEWRGHATQTYSAPPKFKEDHF